MESRRSFIKKIGTSAALSTLAISGATVYASKRTPLDERVQKPIRIGIIGAENSHTIEFGRIFNIEKKFPGVEVVCLWGETEDFARNAMKEGNIPEMVKDPILMLGKIDALIVDHRHARYHLQAAEPFVKAGIPTFIDKPFCYRVAEGKSFLEMAQKSGTPITSYSSIAQSDSTYDLKEQVANAGEINHIIRCGPADPDSIYGGIFFYGIHTVQPLIFIFGDEIRIVRVSRNGKLATASLIYSDGRMATLIFKSLSHEWETFIESKEGIVQLKSRVKEADPAKNYTDMVEMFRTGKEPISHKSILSAIAVLEALEKSVESDSWESVPDFV
jgi:hypothetical protein